MCNELRTGRGLAVTSRKLSGPGYPKIDFRARALEDVYIRFLHDYQPWVAGRPTLCARRSELAGTPPGKPGTMSPATDQDLVDKIRVAGSPLGSTVCSKYVTLAVLMVTSVVRLFTRANRSTNMGRD